MTQLEKQRKHNLEILNALDEAIEKGPWSNNLFFEAAGKKLIEIRERFKKEARLSDADSVNKTSTIADRIAQRAGSIEVYILLYNANGADMKKWAHTISTISAHAVNRPIYRKKEEVLGAMRSVMQPQNVGYIKIYVHEKDIFQLEPDQMPKDRLGNPLLVLNESAINPDNITQFVHTTGQYSYSQGKIFKQSLIG